MLPIPNNILTKFEAILEKRRVAVERRFEFKKWLNSRFLRIEIKSTDNSYRELTIMGVAHISINTFDEYNSGCNADYVYCFFFFGLPPSLLLARRDCD